MSIRPATQEDYQAILDVYNWAVSDTVATFDTEIKSLPIHLSFFKDFELGYPMHVLTQDKKVIGFALVKAFSDRKAYARTCELAIYIKPGFHRKGYGMTLMKSILGAAKDFNQKVILSKIESETVASLELHRKLGFEEVGTLKRVGYKFDRWLDVTIMQKLLS
ncbi:MAG: GNAT family N-acetyltransferase [Halobacteriovoraceae bacterium]|nr:GNAT family N-acetyltransferase [Halobacteriovoraceae bacterium]|tara:strand:- start:2554 stop:3042 length:489 start_codon:yes stop_codon:yes gene_type:complete